MIFNFVQFKNEGFKIIICDTPFIFSYIFLFSHLCQFTNFFIFFFTILISYNLAQQIGMKMQFFWLHLNDTRIRIFIHDEWVFFKLLMNKAHLNYRLINDDFK